MNNLHNRPTSPLVPYLLDTATGIRATHAGYTGGEIGFILEKVQMPPGLFGCVIDRGSSAVNRTWKCAPALEIDLYIKPLALLREFNANNFPWRDDAKSNGKECFRGQ